MKEIYMLKNGHHVAIEWPEQLHGNETEFEDLWEWMALVTRKMKRFAIQAIIRRGDIQTTDPDGAKS